MNSLTVDDLASGSIGEEATVMISALMSDGKEGAKFWSVLAMKETTMLS